MARRLNEFQIKSINRHFKDIDIVGIVFQNETTGTAFYSVYFKHNGFLSACTCAYHSKDLDSPGSASGMVSEIETKSEEIFKKQDSMLVNVNNPPAYKLPRIAKDLAVSFNNVVGHVYQNAFYCVPTPDNFLYQTKKQLREEILKGRDVVSLYTELFEKSDIDFELMEKMIRENEQIVYKRKKKS